MFLVFDDTEKNVKIGNNNRGQANETFNRIYPFTTENIAGYMGDLNLKNKKIITVTGSADHVINSILKGASDITTFDINPLTRHYLDLKIATIKDLSYEDFLYTFLYAKNDLNSSKIKKLNIAEESKEFWLEQLSLKNDNWFKVRRSILFNNEWNDSKCILRCNLYLNKENYNEVKRKLDNVKISFFSADLKDISLKEQFDYMFLSNIIDYIDLMYSSNSLENYCNLIKYFSKNVQQIYFAYLYDIKNDNLKDSIKKIFNVFEIKEFRTALDVDKEEIKDGVLILNKKANYF